MFYNVYGPGFGIRYYNEVINKKPISSFPTLEIDSSLCNIVRANIENSSRGFFNFVERFLSSEDKSIIEITDIEPYKEERVNRHLREERFKMRNESAILLQTRIRVLLGRRKFFKSNKDYFQAKMNKNVIFIQKWARAYLEVIRIKRSLIHDKIIQQRERSGSILKSRIGTFYRKLNLLENLIYEKIISSRKASAIKLQTNWRLNASYRKIQKLLKQLKDNYYLTYPFKANYVRIKIFTEHNTKEIERFYNYEYNEFLECFVLFIPIRDLPTGKYRAQLIVDGLITCDGRFPHIEFNNGQYYNIISLSNNHNKYNIKSLNQKESTLTKDLSSEKASDLPSSANQPSSDQKSLDFYAKMAWERHDSVVEDDLKENLTNKPAFSYFELLNENINNDEYN